jgi:hypothetical protein
MNNKHIDKIDKFFKKDFINNLNDIAIFKNEDGSYELFDKYIIRKVEHCYNLVTKYSSTDKTFSSLKNAVTWCIFDKRNKLDVLSRIEELDRMIDSVDISINIHKRLIEKCKDKELRLIYVAKLSQEQVKRKRYANELLSFINDSKYWQSQRFASRDQK